MAAVVVTWVEVTISNRGTSSATINIFANSSGNPEVIKIYWIEIETVPVNRGTSNNTIPIPVFSSSTGTVSFNGNLGGSNKIIASISGSSSGSALSIYLSLLNITDNSSPSIGTSNITIGFTGTATGVNQPLRIGNSSYLINITGSSIGLLVANRSIIRYISPVRNNSYLPNSITNTYFSSNRTNIYFPLFKIYILFSKIRSNIYSTLSQIGT